jgi:hypothetical protein
MVSSFISSGGILSTTLKALQHQSHKPSNIKFIEQGNPQLYDESAISLDVQ